MTVAPPQPTAIGFDDFVQKIRFNSGPNIRYVSPDGNDDNDGLSWATAMETILAAYDSIEIPGSIEGELYGVIYIAHRSKIHNDPEQKQGIWIMGEGDPYWSVEGHNYQTEPAPAGWRKSKHVLFKGVGGESLSYARPTAAQLGQLGLYIDASGITHDIQEKPYTYYVYDDKYPAIWISGGGEIAFEDLLIRNRRVGIYLGKAREGVNHINNDDARYCYFRNVCIDVLGWSVSHLNPHAGGDRPRIIQDIRRAHPELSSFDDESNTMQSHISRYVHERVGPCVDSEKGLKVAFENCVFSTTHHEQRTGDPDLSKRYGGYSDNRACIVARTPSLISISSCLFKGGNFKYYGGTHPFGFDIRDCFFEGSFILEGTGGVTPVGPLVHIIEAAEGSAFIENVGAGDVSTEADVKVEGGEQVAGAVVCINVATVKGPATILNIPNIARWQNIPWTLARQRQVGFWQGRVSAQHDSARRAFSPVAARFKNLVEQDPSTYIRLNQVRNPKGGPKIEKGPKIETGIIAPDGTRGAFRLSPLKPWTATAPERKRVLLLDVNDNKSTNTNIYINKGDVIVAGVWVRAAGKHGLPPWVIHLMEIVLEEQHHYKFDNGLELLFANAPLKGDGEWEWISVAGRVKEVPIDEATHSGLPGKVLPRPTKLYMYLNCVNYFEEDPNTHKILFKHSHPHDFYAPILLHIPGNDVSENEIYELRQHISTWPDNVEPGTVSLQRGQDFALQSHIVSRGTGLKTLGKGVGVDGNDVSGRIYVKKGSIIDQGVIATLGFSKSFRTEPRVLLTAANFYASTIPVFVESSKKEFSIHTTKKSGKLEKISEWNYFVIE